MYFTVNVVRKNIYLFNLRFNLSANIYFFFLNLKNKFYCVNFPIVKDVFLPHPSLLILFKIKSNKHYCLLINQSIKYRRNIQLQRVNI